MLWCLTDDRQTDLALLSRAAEMGYTFARLELCEQSLHSNNEEAFRLAQLSAVQLERDGFYWLGRCLCSGLGCKTELDSAKQNLLIAAELGHVWAADFVGDFAGESDPSCWLWWSRAALRGNPDSLLVSFSKQVELFFSGSENATIVFLIGRALKGNIDVEKKKILGESLSFSSLIGPANQAVSFYFSQINCARLAVDTWALVGTRLHLIKDMRIYIGKLIWEARFEANYVIETVIAPLSSRAQKRSRSQK